MYNNIEIIIKITHYKDLVKNKRKGSEKFVTINQFGFSYAWEVNNGDTILFKTDSTEKMII